MSAYTRPALNSNVSPFLGTAKAPLIRLTAIMSEYVEVMLEGLLLKRTTGRRTRMDVAAIEQVCASFEDRLDSKFKFEKFAEEICRCRLPVASQDGQYQTVAQNATGIKGPGTSLSLMKLFHRHRHYITGKLLGAIIISRQDNN